MQLRSVTTTEEQWLRTGSHAPFPRQTVNGTRPILLDDLDQGICAIDDAGVRAEVSGEVKRLSVFPLPDRGGSVALRYHRNNHRLS